MSLKIFSNVEKLNADDVRVHQLSGDTDGILAAYYDKNNNVSLYMSGASATLGNVGVKTSSPEEALTVVGNISASGTIYASDAHIPMTVTNKTSTYTLALSDMNSVVTLSAASETTLSIPANSAVSLPIGSTVTVVQLGSGQIVVDGNGYDLSSSTGHMKTASQHSVITLYKINANEWVLAGDLSKN